MLKEGFFCDIIEMVVIMRNSDISIITAKAENIEIHKNEHELRL